MPFTLVSKRRKVNMGLCATQLVRSPVALSKKSENLWGGEDKVLQLLPWFIFRCYVLSLVEKWCQQRHCDNEAIKFI